MIDRLRELDRTKLVAAVLCVGLLGVLAVFAYSRLADDELPEGAVLEYGDRVVTEDDLEERVEILGALYGVQRPEDDADGEQFDKDAAKSMAVSLILDEAIVEHEIEIPERKAQDQLDQLIEDQLVGGRQAFVDWLTEVGINEQDVLDEITSQLATSRLVEEVVQDVPDVTDDDVRAAYDEHRDRMVTPEARRLLNIVVETKQDAQLVLEALRGGEDFGEVAATWSRDGSTRDSGGDLGLVTADQLEADYAEAAFGARRGSLFGPVQTQYGWNVGQVADVRPSTPLAFADVKETLAGELQNRERLEVWRDFLGDLLEGADVEYADAYLPDDPTAPPSDLPEATSGDAE